MTRIWLEKYQVLFYMAAIVAGLSAGTVYEDQTSIMEHLLWPVLGILLYATFTQVPLSRLSSAIRDGKFLAAAITGNFIVVPIVAWGLVNILPDDPAVRIGAFMVLLVPCTDWFITFTHLGRGDTKNAIAFAPISLLLQIILLPVYLLLFMGPDLVVSLAHSEMLFAFSGLIVLPLLLAYLSQQLSRKRNAGWIIEGIAWFPVPLLAIVVFIVAASQVALVAGSLRLLGWLASVYAIYLCAALLLAYILSKIFRLRVAQGRVLAFSLGSRNSFVILPIALALPVSFEMAVVAIVCQSLVELFGMLIYLWLVPKILFYE